MPPIPRANEIALPNPALGAACYVLGIRIGAAGIARPIECQALTNEPTRQVLMALVTGRHQTREPIASPRYTPHRCEPKPVGQSAEGTPATAVEMAVGGAAALPPLGRIDAKHTNGGADDFERIAIDDMRTAADRAGRECRFCNSCCGEYVLGARQSRAVRHREQSYGEQRATGEQEGQALHGADTGLSAP